MILYQYFLISALILSWKYKSSLIKFEYFILTVCIFEGIGKVMRIIYNNNTIVYNFYFVFLISYYIYIFSYEINKLLSKKIKLYELGLFLIISLITFCYYHNLNNLNAIAYNIGMLIVILLIYRYFYLLIIGKSYLNLSNTPLFWLASGILLFYSSAFPILSFTNIFITYDIQLARAFQKWVQYGNLFIAVSYNLVILCTYFKKV